MDLVFIIMNELKLIEHLYYLLSYYSIYYHIILFIIISIIYIVQNSDFISKTKFVAVTQRDFN